MVRERGQLLLIASVLIATTILGSVILLNSIHASPDVNAYKEKQSLSQAEQQIGQVRGNLEELFLVKDSVNGPAGEPLPYVRDENDFRKFIDTYTSAQNNLSTLAGSGVVSVSLDNTEEGMVVRQSEEANFRIEGSNTWHVIAQRAGGPGNPEDIKYVHLNITAVSGDFGMEFDNSDKIEFRETPSGEVTVFAGPIGGLSQACTDSFATPFEVELRNTEVEIRSDNNVCRFEFATGEQTRFEFTNHDNPEGQFTIVAVGENSDLKSADPSNDDDIDVFGNNPGNWVHVVPTFEVEYVDPNMNFESKITIYGGNDDSG